MYSWLKKLPEKIVMLTRSIYVDKIDINFLEKTDRKEEGTFCRKTFAFDLAFYHLTSGEKLTSFYKKWTDNGTFLEINTK